MDDEVRVLIIDDDATLAEMYKLRLQADGYIVEVATDGQEGVERARSMLPDFIYLDLRMPHLDGFSALELLRSHTETSGTPVVIITNYDEPELRARGLALGALEFLVKSATTPARLSRTVARVSKISEASSVA